MMLERLKRLEFRDVDNDNLRANAERVREKIMQYKEDIDVMERVTNETLSRRFTI